MKFFIDTAKVEDIKAANDMGVICGVTTNPSLIAKEGRDFKEVIKEITSIVDGPISGEVKATTTDAEGMIKEGREIAAIHPNMVVKIPMTVEGLKAVKVLHAEGIKTNVTLIFTANQALLAARAGATYVSPFLGRLDDISTRGVDLIREIAEIFEVAGIETEIIAASVRNPIHVTDCALAGADIATVPYNVIVQMTKHPLTDAGIEKFQKDYKAVFGEQGEFTTMEKLELQKIANEVRKDIVTALHSAKAGHPGGSLSAADVFTYLYFEEMNIDPKDPKKADRDRFVLSKGHTAPGYYSALAERGFFPKEDLKTLRHLGSYLQGHPDMKHIPGVDMSSGSLGQGISAAVGMALSAKLSNESYRVYTLLGDGEIQEGQVWEAAMFAGFRKLDNLVVIVDNNGLQIDGKVDEVCSPYPIDKKFEAFNFHVINVADGNDMDQLRAAFDEAKATKGMPTAIIMKTVKGKGVSFMENQVGWHGKAPNDEQYAQAMEELEKAGEALCQK